MSKSSVIPLPAGSPIGPARTGIAVVLLTFGLLGGPAWGGPPGQTHSTNIALGADGKLLFNVNREADSVSVFRIVPGGGGLDKLAEVAVGREPICIAVGSGEAFVTNSASGTVSVLEWNPDGRIGVTAQIAVGPEPRGCALTPDGRFLYVANYSAGTVTAIDAGSRMVIGRLPVRGNPGALAIADGRAFVTQFFARPIPGGPGEGFDDGREAVVQAFPAYNPSQVVEIALSPLADSGFTANRKDLCPLLNPLAVNDTFCPDPKETDPTDPIITMDPQGVFPNQLKSGLICKGKLYLPNIGAQPEPPLFFNTNVQALVHVVDAAQLSEREDLHVNLNAQIKLEPQPPDPTASLGRLFGNDVVAIDADPECENVFVVSRGGNYVLRARLGPNGQLSIGAPDNVLRFQTGNIPTGIAVDSEGRRAYVNNEVGLSVSVLDLESGTVIARDVPSSVPPAAGTFEHRRLLGKLVFFTALGVPDNGLGGTEIRDIVPLEDRGKQSDNAWSTCASCHDDGLADGVTWIFETGPRQSIPLDGTYAKLNGAHNARILNWSAVRDSNTDFNNNSRTVQCGAGFAGGDPPISCNPASPGGLPNPNVFNHGIANGASEALDVETTWVQTVRALNARRPPADDLAVGAEVFESTCASCHGGPKWTKSQLLYGHDPGFVAGVPRDPGVTNSGDQIVSYTDGAVDPEPLTFLEVVGTFDAENPIEIRQNGQAPFGELGFNVPSLLGAGNNAPYFHHGAAPTLEAVFATHQLPGGGSIDDALDPAERAALLLFVRAIDGQTPIFRSAADDFHEPFSP